MYCFLNFGINLELSVSGLCKSLMPVTKKHMSQYQESFTKITWRQVTIFYIYIWTAMLSRIIFVKSIPKLKWWTFTNFVSIYRQSWVNNLMCWILAKIIKNLVCWPDGFRQDCRTMVGGDAVLYHPRQNGEKDNILWTGP